MRNKLIGCAALAVLAATLCVAEELYQELIVTVPTTNAAQVLTATVNPKGYIDEIYFDVPSLSTANVTVVATPNICTNALAPTCLYTNSALTANVVARPRVFQTDKTGTAITNLSVSERFLCAGDAVVLRVVQASGLTNSPQWRAWLKIKQ